MSPPFVPFIIIVVAIVAAGSLNHAVIFLNQMSNKISNSNIYIVFPFDPIFVHFEVEFFTPFPVLERPGT